MGLEKEVLAALSRRVEAMCAAMPSLAEDWRAEYYGSVVDLESLLAKATRILFEAAPEDDEAVLALASLREKSARRRELVHGVCKEHDVLRAATEYQQKPTADSFNVLTASLKEHDGTRLTTANHCAMIRHCARTMHYDIVGVRQRAGDAVEFVWADF